MGVKKNAITGAKWTGTSKVTTSLLQIIQVVALGRILEPEAFGLMSMVMVVIGFSQAYMDMGISNAIIYKQDSTHRQLSTLYWINVIAGLLLFGFLNLITPLIVDFYQEDRLTGLLFLTSFIFVITPWGQQFYVLLQKQLRFKLLAGIEILASFFGVVISILLAYDGYGVYSLIWGQLIIVGVRSILSAIIGYQEFRPSFVFLPLEVKEYLSFGLYQMGEKSSNYFSKNIDYLLIGRYFGPEILGAYTIAFQLIIKPVQKINPILNRVAFPLFSKHKNDNALLRKGYYQLSKFLTFVSYPLLIFLAATASVTIPVVLGKGWELTVLLVPILVIVGLVRTLGNPVGSIYLAKGRADLSFYFNMCIALTNLIVFYIAAQYSVYHVAGAFACLNIFYYIGHRYMVDYIISSNWKNYLHNLWKNILIAVSCGSIVFILTEFVQKDTIGLVILILIMIAAFLLCQYLFNKKYTQEVFWDYLGIKL